MNFDQAEKMAVVKAIAETIDLDDQYKVGELMKFIETTLFAEKREEYLTRSFIQ